MPLLGLFVLLLGSFSELVTAETVPENCDALPGIRSICGLQAPEDLVLSPFDDALIMGEFGGLPTHTRGGLVRLDLATQQLSHLYPKGQQQSLAKADNWGDGDCQAPSAAGFAPHGLHLSQRENGDWQLLVVNHWERESIEFFQLGKGDQLTWRGCVEMPAGAYLNDVVGLADGSFYATHMLNKDDSEAVAAAMQGQVTGHLFEWHPSQAVRIMPSSAMSFPNGIQISADENYLWVNIYSLGEVRKIDRTTAKVLATVKIPSPDNSNWSDDGKLLVASHTGEMDYEGGECTQVDRGFCAMAFAIVELDPETLETRQIFSHQGAPMGAGTAAIKIGQQLYIGSFAGDRLLQVDLSVFNSSKPTP